ncbi:hypothetical protein NP233_g11720 [Leucocoprinus birnbaumii]|uniref:Serine/threonine-protein kinase TEL1 n=1 Tax=Leucocoprinus birnbaumii TaxID=56174 RepID=A0AAD5VHN0_9AGAR|nr:hypothetical protein NP233_g11720 [Leucocoprinus birnbaumii]
MRFIAAGPLLQSISGEPTRDTDIIDTILGCGIEHAQGFLSGLSCLLAEVRRRTFSLSTNLQGYLDTLDDFFGSYEYEQSERMQQLVSQFLHSILEIWLTNAETRSQVHALPKWLLKRNRKGTAKYRTERDAFIRFVDKMTLREPRALEWLLMSGDKELSDETLLTSLPLIGWNQDSDIRIRFRVAILNARVFHAIQHLDIYPSALYKGIQGLGNDIEADQYEQFLSRFLMLGNIMVASSSVRRGPYWHLIETCFVSTEYTAHIEAILAAVSESLELTPSSLFEAYASQMGYSMMKSSDGDIARIPPHLLGFEDRKQSASFTLSAFAPTYITGQFGPQFEAHCKLVDVSPEDTYLVCFGDIVGAVSAYWFMNAKDQNDTQELENLLRQTTYSADFDKDLKDNADGVALALIRSISDQVISSVGSIHQCLEQRGKATADTFASLVKYRLNDRYDLHEPNLPAFSVSIVLRSLFWLSSKTPSNQMKPMTYHILHGLFAAIHRTPVVNEQLRLANNLAVWISLRRDDFSDVTLLHTLVQGSATLLTEPDLAHAAQSMLEWAFLIYEKLKIKDSAFSNIIIRICSIVHDYAQSRYEDLQKLGLSLMEWVDKQAIILSNAGVKVQVHRALPTWPYPPIPDLARIASKESSESLAALLDDNRITYNKFRLVRSLYDHVSNGGYLKDQFPKLDFWRLKDCIPGKTELQQEDIEAFASLLFFNHGDIGGITGEHCPPNSILSRYRRASGSKKDSTKSSRFIREIITHALLQQLDNRSSTHVFSAYQTLRRIMVVLGGLDVYSGPSDYSTELEYLRAFPRRAGERSSCKLSEVLALDSMLDITAKFSQWITVFSTRLSDCLAEYDDFFAQLSPILTDDTDLARELLPILIHGVLRTEISDENYISKEYRRLLTDYLTSVLDCDHTDMACRRSVIDIVLHLREFRPLKMDLSFNQWLSMDYQLLAKNAVLCGAYTTALLFLELSLDYPHQRPQNGTSPEELLYEIYSHIDEPDGFYGIKTDNLHQFLARRYHHEKQWGKALQFHGAALEAEPSNATESDGLLQSFSAFGFSHLVMNTLRTDSSTSSTSLDYRLGWRTGTWDLPERKEFSAGSSLYFAVRAVYQERDSLTIKSTIHKGFRRTMDRLRSLGSENLSEIREVVREIMCLKQIDDWRKASTQNRLQKRQVDPNLWKDLVDIDPHFDFPDLETIMATRISLLHSSGQREEAQQIGNMATPFAKGLKELEKRCLIRLSQAARDANQVQIALNSIMRAHKLYLQSPAEVSEEFANVLWEQGEQTTAIQYLKKVVDPLDPLVKLDAQATTYHALLRARLGSWMATACLEKPTTIWEGYLQKAIQELAIEPPSDAESIRSRATVYHDCAVFAEQQYHAILKSPDAIRWRLYVERKRQEVNELMKEMASTQDQNKRFSLDKERGKADKILKEDSERFQKHNADRDRFLQQALEMFGRSLEVSDIYDDDAPIRFCSLWFANFDSGEDLHSTIGAALSRIPSYKMVFLAHQLTARLSWPMGRLPKSQENIHEVVLRMCREHPFHSLYQLYCLLPHSERQSSSNRQSDRVMTPTTPSTQTERGSAAQNVFERLRADQTVAEKVADIEKLCNASWEWAKYPFENISRRTPVPGHAYNIPSSLFIYSLKDLKIPVPTALTPLDPTMQYADCDWVTGFEKQFRTAGGVNLPKITVCISSKNVRYRQLFKGGKNDDLRQDAVMEQVFDVVNAVLCRDRQTKRRELRVRGYKVIPLDSQSGLIEFVANTTPLKDWLGPAHSRIRPKDLSKVIRVNGIQRLINSSTADADKHKLLQTFHDIRREFKPVMRHYFAEMGRSPVVWFAMRLKYTRSVATTSIVGHILGLGDRHISNILLDNNSGEVVHIDLGIAFDQRIWVDGMGSSGTKGVFQQCAEETLRVLRSRSDVIMTVLEVFKHDPLHSWTVSDRKLQNVQRSDRNTTADNQAVNDLAHQVFGFGIGIDMTSGTAEEAADRALSSVARKLDKSLSVEYTVNQLIADATDPLNLARMFAGWSPHY